ncbi:hypothetical protein CEXT_349511 [Caerostris extrusa]|uniref:Uncharacterized protein n=1 Tax=Caerostris extrusa TaxID=172846 RepID=A0AAV4VB35_CAEEX|nr:hypothetical protein CEXT_349511 [Caerostris extrusa]
MPLQIAVGRCTTRAKLSVSLWADASKVIGRRAAIPLLSEQAGCHRKPQQLQRSPEQTGTQLTPPLATSGYCFPLHLDGHIEESCLRFSIIRGVDTERNPSCTRKKR